MSNNISPVIVITRKIKSKDKWLNINYPVVINMVDKIVQNKINKTIKKLVYSIIKKQGYYDRAKVTVEGWYEIKSNERGILSLTIGNYSYSYPSAHGLTIIKSLTFDMITGKKYEFFQLFKKNSNYIEKISKIISKQIEQREIDLIGEFKGVDGRQDYYIADKCLIVYFQTYEISPYVWGLPYFPICLYKIENIIAEAGPLEVMLPM